MLVRIREPRRDTTIGRDVVNALTSDDHIVVIPADTTAENALFVEGEYDSVANVIRSNVNASRVLSNVNSAMLKFRGRRAKSGTIFGSMDDGTEVVLALSYRASDNS